MDKVVCPALLPIAALRPIRSVVMVISIMPSAVTKMLSSWTAWIYAGRVGLSLC